MNKWKFEQVDVKFIMSADLNANKMTDAEFKKLIQNIQKSGGLSGAITCYKKEDGMFVIISGHNRYKACVKLNYITIPVVYALEEDLTKDEIIALQLSHNSLHGTDDKGILKRLFEEIKSVDFKEFAYINIDEIGDVKTENYSFAPELTHYSVTLVLYHDAFQNLKELLEIVDQSIPTSDLVVIADGYKAENELLKLFNETRKQFNIASSGASFSKILELAQIGINSTKSTI